MTESSHDDNNFGVADYIVFASVLVISAGIGIYYGLFGTRQKTTDEFLLADRSMSSVPVALSLFCSFISAIAILGTPAEIYLYGTQFGMISLAFVPLTFTLIYFYVPVFFNLGINSAYEYLELRFSMGVRTFVSSLAIFHLIAYMAIVVFGPALALEQVIGINKRLSTALIFLVCIFYSSLGGLKAILWTDSLQAVIMMGSVTFVVIKGVVDFGGMDIILQRADETDRIQFFNFDPDPRTRHTFWTSVVGTYFMFLPMYAATQQQVQRYLSLPSLASCTRALLLNMIGLMLIHVLCVFAGSSFLQNILDVSSSDQLLPFFVIETSKGVPGLPGLFVAGITCASLSTVSSGLSALSSILTYDYVQKWAPHLTDLRLSLVSKLMCVLFGTISFGFVFVAENMGNILPATTSLLGMILGPTLGIFTLGMFFPWTNSKGAICGMVSTFILMVSLTIGTFIALNDHRLPDQRLSLSTETCPLSSHNQSSTLTLKYEQHNSTLFQDNNGHKNWKENEDTILIQILSLSYCWNSGLACLLTVILGHLFSFLFQEKEMAKRHRIRRKLLSPPLVKFWSLLCPKILAHWIIEDADETFDRKKTIVTP